MPRLAARLTNGAKCLSIAVCGIALSRGELRLAVRAFELFLTNFAAIQFTTSVMIRLSGFRQAESLTWLRLLARNWIGLALLAALTILLGITLLRTVRKHRLEVAIQQHITTSVQEVDGAELIRLTFEYHRTPKVLATAVVVTPAPFHGDVISNIKTGLPQSNSHEIDIKMLHIRTGAHPLEAAWLKSVTLCNVARLPSFGEPRDTLLGRAVGKRFWDDAPLCFSLKSVVADR